MCSNIRRFGNKIPFYFWLQRKNKLHLLWYKNLYLSLPKIFGMPTLLITFGMRFFFYLDEHQPIHVHVDCNGKKAKIALEPSVGLVYNHGMKEQELKKAIDTCAIYRDDFIEEWHKRFD